MKKIKFNNGTVPALSAENMNELQDNIEEAITEEKLKMYPIGSIFESTDNTEPSTFLGGNWEPITCHSKIKTESKQETINGIIVTYTYSIFADGIVEIYGHVDYHSLLKVQGDVYNFELPFTSNMTLISSLAEGGAYWSWVNTRIQMIGNNMISVGEWNNSDTESAYFAINFYGKGTIDLEANNLQPIYAWKRIADTEEAD